MAVKVFERGSVAELGYDKDSKSLLVIWQNGVVSEYSGVTSDDADWVFGARAPWVAVHRHLKGKYPHKWAGLTENDWHDSND